MMYVFCRDAGPAHAHAGPYAIEFRYGVFATENAELAEIIRRKGLYREVPQAEEDQPPPLGLTWAELRAKAKDQNIPDWWKKSRSDLEGLVT